MPITSSVSPEAITAYGEAEQQRMHAAGVVPAGMSAPGSPNAQPPKRTLNFSFLHVLLIVGGVAVIAAVIREYGLPLLFDTPPRPANDGGAGGGATPPTDLLAPLLAVSLAVERLIETGFAWYERSTRSVSNVLKQFQTTGEWVGQELNNAIQAVEHAAAKLGTEAETEDLIKFNLAKQRLSDAEELIHGWIQAPEYIAFKRAASIMIGIVAGLVVAIGGDLGLLRALGFDAPAVLDMIITGFAVGSGPGPMHTIIGMLQGAKDSLAGLATSLNNNSVKSEVDKIRAEMAYANIAQSQAARGAVTAAPITPAVAPPVTEPSAPTVLPAGRPTPSTPPAVPPGPPGPGDDGAWG